MKLKFLITFLILFAFTQSTFALRGVSSDNVSLEGAASLNESKQLNLIKDPNQKLYSIVGKSQILKFDRNVKRISIANPELADIVLLSPKQILLNGKKSGRTSLIFWSSETGNPVFYNLIVENDYDAFVQAVQQLTSEDDINIVFNDDGAVLSGHVSSTATKKQIEELAKAYNIKLLNLAESKTKQVLLEVKVTEATRQFTKELSSSFGVGDGITSNNLSKLVFGPITGGVSSGLQYIFTNNAANLSWQLDLAETKGNAKILAEPKLLVADGSKASFNVGTEVPVPSQMGQYGNISYEFKNTGVILEFTPTILEKSRRVLLKLTPEVSEVDESVSIVQPGGGSVPGFRTRKVDTTVELNDGETLVIAGLFNQKSSSSRSQVPLIGNIPFIGWLFSSLKDTKNDNELLIIITPKIVDEGNYMDRI